MAWTRYAIKHPKRAWSIISPDDWGYHSGFAVATDAGIATIMSDKAGRALTLGVVYVALWPKEWRPERRYDDDAPDRMFGAWCFDRRIVAMVADFLMKHGWGGSEGEPYPKLGEEIYLPTAEEADVIYEKYNIPTPQNNQECDRLFCDSVEVGDDGMPLNPNAEID